MPELPEVQTTVNYLSRRIRGRTITAAWMDPDKPVNTGSSAAWPAIRRHLVGRRIFSVTRRAKYIVIGLDDGSRLLVHQKMTGHLLIGSWAKKSGTWISCLKGPLADDPMNRYIRVLLTFDNGRQMALSDARRFARLILIRPGQTEAQIKETAALGPEPLTLSPKEFITLFSGVRGLIKPKLMDPSFIVGIGNIYADEILHMTGVHPLRPVTTLSREDLALMHRHMRTVLTVAIRLGGSSTDDYRNPDGGRGRYQGRHRAYHRTGKPCTICRKGTIERLVKNGRSAHFCNTHQL